jgi:CTP synthase
MKTKPVQHSVMKLREIGIEPSMLICRMEKPLTQQLQEKIAMFCNVEVEAVIEEKDVASSIYEVPILLKAQRFDDLILSYLHISCPRASFRDWEEMVHNCKHPKNSVTIAVAGKYTELKDAYKSIWEALQHGGVANLSAVQIKYLDVEKENIEKELAGVDGILVPGGFGDRGVEGKIRVIRYARENKVPFFGICLGMQCAVMEFARNVCEWKDANSTEFNPNTKHPVIDLLAEQKRVKKKGATMRLGGYPCKLKKASLSKKAYGKEFVIERHRHRYEFNARYANTLKKAGLNITGIYPKRRLVEIVELSPSVHPWFVGVQFHPEFQSRPIRPHPLFKDFVAASLYYAQCKKIT